MQKSINTMKFAESQTPYMPCNRLSGFTAERGELSAKKTANAWQSGKVSDAVVARRPSTTRTLRVNENRKRSRRYGRSRLLTFRHLLAAVVFAILSNTAYGQEIGSYALDVYAGGGVYQYEEEVFLPQAGYVTTDYSTNFIEWGLAAVPIDGGGLAPFVSGQNMSEADDPPFARDSFSVGLGAYLPTGEDGAEADWAFVLKYTSSTIELSSVELEETEYTVGLRTSLFGPVFFDFDAFLGEREQARCEAQSYTGIGSSLSLPINLRKNLNVYLRAGFRIGTADDLVCGSTTVYEEHSAGTLLLSIGASWRALEFGN